MMTFILLAALTADSPPQAPPVNPRLAVGYCSLVVSCKCTDDGSPCVCVETGEFCGCADCAMSARVGAEVARDSAARRETPRDAATPKRLTTRVIQDGWVYQRSCSRNGCTTVRVPRMVTVQVEE